MLIITLASKRIGAHLVKVGSKLRRTEAENIAEALEEETKERVHDEQLQRFQAIENIINELEYENNNKAASEI